MSGGRPRTSIGTYGRIKVTQLESGRYRASTRHRDRDGQLRRVRATDRTERLAEAELKRRIANRRGFGGDGTLGIESRFAVLADLWLEDLETRKIAEATKDNYRDDLRLYVRPYFEHFSLAEITTARVETFLKAETSVSYSRAKHSRTVLNQIFNFALRHDAIPRNPVEGTSPLHKPTGRVRAMSLEQVQAIRQAAAQWRTGPRRMGPKPDGQVRDACEVLLGTSVRPGEVLALRPCDVSEGRNGLIVAVRGTVVYRTGAGTLRQDHPKTDASVRMIPVPEFAADIIRERMKRLQPDQREWTIFHNRNGGPLSLHNFRCTFREFLKLAGLKDTGITPRWYRRTGATVLARGLGVEAAASHLGHTSTAITEGHYIEPERVIDFGASHLLEAAFRPVDPDGSLLARTGTDDEEDVLERIDPMEGEEPSEPGAA
jgi:integrase